MLIASPDGLWTMCWQWRLLIKQAYMLIGVIYMSI